MRISSIIASAIITIFLAVNISFAASAVELMNEGKMNLYNGNIQEGIRLLEESEKMDNTNLITKLLLAKGYSWDNEWDKAKKYYGNVTGLSSPSKQIYWEGKFGIAQVTSWEKKYDEALKLYGEILASDADLSDGLLLDVKLAIGDIYSWQLEYVKAIEHFKKLLEEKPGNTVILNRIAKIYLWMGDYSNSRECTDKVLAINKNDNEALQRRRILDQIQPYSLTLGYDYTYYTSKNTEGRNIQTHTAVTGFTWQYSMPLMLFAYITEITQNSIETTDIEKASDWNYDVNFKLGASYRINSLTYIALEGEYAAQAVIFPDFTSQISLSRKLTQNLDIIGLYKYTYDNLDTAQTVSNKQYHLFSPGLIIYFKPEVYNKLQFYVETDSKDMFYSFLMQQYFEVNPENILQLYLFISQGRSYMTFSESTVIQETTTQSLAVVYSHFFNSSWGVEFSTGMTNSANNYKNYHGGINVIYKW